MLWNNLKINVHDRGHVESIAELKQLNEYKQRCCKFAQVWSAVTGVTYLRSEDHWAHEHSEYSVTPITTLYSNIIIGVYICNLDWDQVTLMQKTRSLIIPKALYYVLCSGVTHENPILHAPVSLFLCMFPTIFYRFNVVRKALFSLHWSLDGRESKQ